MGRTARGTGKHWARCASISWSFCWSCITIVHQWEQWWRLLSAIYVTPGELEQADTKNISRSQRNITKAGEGVPKLRSFCSHEAWTTTTTKNKLNSHERKQCACNQEDDAGHFACSTVAVVAVATINLALTALASCRRLGTFGWCRIPWRTPRERLSRTFCRTYKHRPGMLLSSCSGRSVPKIRCCCTGSTPVYQLQEKK